MWAKHLAVAWHTASAQYVLARITGIRAENIMAAIQQTLIMKVCRTRRSYKIPAFSAPLNGQGITIAKPGEHVKDPYETLNIPTVSKCRMRLRSLTHVVDKKRIYG